MRIAISAAALSVILGSITVFASPAGGDDCAKVKQKRLDKIYNVGGACSANCLDGDITTLIRAANVKGGHHDQQRVEVSLHLVATDAGHYYLYVWSSVIVGNVRGEKGYAVRATEDPLVLMFEGGGEMQLYPVCDLSSKKSGSNRRVQYLCGFYNVSRAQLEELSGKRLSEIKQFFLASNYELFENRHLKYAKDGRSYFDFTWKVERNKPAELMRQSRCIVGSE